MAVRLSQISLRNCCSTERRTCVSSAFAAMQSGPHFAHQTLHAADREIEIDGKGGIQVLDATDRFRRVRFPPEIDRSGPRKSIAHVRTPRPVAGSVPNQLQDRSPLLRWPRTPGRALRV